MDIEVLKNIVVEWLKVYYWDVFFVMSIFSLGSSFLIAAVCALKKPKKVRVDEEKEYYKKRKHGRIITPIRILFIGAFISSLFFFVPLYYQRMWTGEAWDDIISSVLASLQHAIRLFTVDGDFREFVTEIVEYKSNIFKRAFRLLGGFLFFYAPLLTVSFIMSFLKNMFSHLRYKITFRANVHVFSELNEKTMAMAEDIWKTGKRFGIFAKDLIVFTDIIDKIEEENIELIEEANRINAILFRKDLCSINFDTFTKRRNLKFYLISEDEDEKVRHTEGIVKNYDRENVEVFVFSDDVSTFLFLSSLEKDKIVVSRINDVQTLIYHELDRNGKNLFEKARDVGSKDKIISVIIVGLGRYGTEMLKALTWYCQLQGYYLKINAFDANEKAEEHFCGMCPELMDAEHNNQNIDGEARYSIKIHSGVDVNSISFLRKLEKIDDATFVFISLGDDNSNLSVSEKIRAVYDGMEELANKEKPCIETVVYNTEISNNMGVTWDEYNENLATRKKEIEMLEAGKKPEVDYNGVVNHKNEPYNIITIGNLESFYSKGTFNELDERGKVIHTKWARQNLSEAKKCMDLLKTEECKKESEKYKEELKKCEKELKKCEKELAKAEVDYKRFEYFYRSSVSQAIHKKLREDLGLAVYVTEEEWNSFTVAKKRELAKNEHVRWNAYMRTEGFRYGKKRNDLAKRHPNLVSVYELPESKLSLDI